MRRALLGGLASLMTTYAVSPAVRRLLVERGTMDVPNQRSSHTEPVPRGGGLACLAGVACGIATTGSHAHIDRRVVFGIASLAALGLADDQSGHLDPRLRLALQTVSGGLLNSNGSILLPAASLVTAGVVNVVNFMDGINGITGSTAAVWGISTWATGRNSQDAMLQTLGAVTAGAGLGFLPWNAPHAQLFLGDVGSYLFGGLMAAATVHAIESPSLAWRVAAPLLPYGVDAAQAVLLRARRRASLTEAHREHVYQRLVDSHGLSHTAVATIHATVAATIAVTSRSQRLLVRFGVTSLLAAGYVALPSLLPERLEANA